MIWNLLLGLPNDRPGGLILTVLFFIVAGLGAVGVGLMYATIGTLWPRASLPLQAASALLRGVPLLLLMFFVVQMTVLPVSWGGLIALFLYSFSHVGEVLRSFLTAYPEELRQQALVTGLGPLRDWIQLRIPWTFGKAIDALGTHWISLLKDTGALVILGIGELTSAAKVLSETTASQDHWLTVLIAAAAIYLLATLALMEGIRSVRKLHWISGLV
jgi:ABC-type amino acid transport system permease subunit